MYYLLDNTIVSITYVLILRRYVHRYLGVKGHDICHLSLNGSAKITIIICLILWKELSQIWYNAKRQVKGYMGVHQGTLANFLLL